MYRVFANDTCIYNDAFALTETRAVSPKLIMEDSAAGSLTITLPKENAGYETVERLTTDISVERAGKIIWTGRVINDRKDFWNNRVLTCEGELAFFNDSTQPPYEYKGLSVRDYLQALLTVHNSRVGSNRRFTLGAVTVHDGDLPTRYTNNEKTIELINALKEQLGGHFRVRHEGGARYLDYLEDCAKAATQTIQFGRNLIEFTRHWDSTEYATAIVPLGARLDDSPIKELDAYLTVETVNSGSMYVQNASAVAAYGWIEKVVRWDDVTDAAQLLAKAKKYLSDLQFDNMQIELSALDMRYLDPTAQPVELLDEIRVISRPHGLDRFFPVTRLEIPLDEPEKSTFQLGDSVQTPLTRVNNEISAKIMQTIENLPKAHNIIQTAKDNAMAIMNMATTGYVSLLKDEYGSESLAITQVRISRQEDLRLSRTYWLWNMNGLAFFRNYGQELGVAITMDGAIVADFITAGTMSADRVRTGILKDYNENVVFNLTTGTLTMKKGSIDIGNGVFKVDTDGNLTATKGTFAGKLVAASGTFAGALQAATGNFKGTVEIGGTAAYPAFKVDADGNVSIGVTSSATAFKVDKNGNVTVGGTNLSPAFKVDKDGNVSITKGSISIGTVTEDGKSVPAFYVDSSGNLTARKGTFKGAVEIGGTTAYPAFKVDTSGNVSIGVTSSATAFKVDKNGNVKIGGTSSYPAFQVDKDGNVIIGKTASKQAFKVDNTGNVTVGGTASYPAFKVDTDGNVAIGVTASKSAFKVSKDGDMTVGGTSSSPAFKVDKDGNVTITKGSISIGTKTVDGSTVPAFYVDSNGNLTARSGTFKGTIEIGGTTSYPAFKVDTSGNVSIGVTASATAFKVDKSGNVKIGGTSSYPAFQVDSLGNVIVGKTASKQAFKVDNTGNVTIGGTSSYPAFKVDTDGNVAIGVTAARSAFKVSKDGDMTVGGTSTAPNFKVDKDGDVTIKRGSISIGTTTEDGKSVPAFYVDSNGNLTARKGKFRGAIDVNGNFTVDISGNMKAVNGDFSGTLRASNIVGKISTSTGGSIESGSLSIGSNSGVGELVGGSIYVPNKTNPQFKVDQYGNVTIKSGSIHLGPGSSIDWSNTTNSNITYAPGYGEALAAQTAANNAATAASNAQWTANAASTAAAAAQARADSAYANMCSDEKVFNILTGGGTRFGLFYSESGRLYINANYIKSGTISADFVTLACNYGGFCKGYGYDGQRTTYGSMMYGSNGVGSEPYFIVTNTGCRMSARDWLYVASNGVNVSSEPKVGSDRRIKNSISYTMDQYEKFFMALRPARFKYNSGLSGRMHTGFIAQDVEDALKESGLTNRDLAALCVDELSEPTEGLTDTRYSLRYGEFVALNTYMIQKLYHMVEALLRKESA